MSQHIIQYNHFSKQLYLPMFIKMNHCFGLKSLASAILSVLDTHLLSRYSVVVLCHGDPAALSLQDQLFCLLQQFIDGVDVGVDQLKALDLGKGGS